MFTSLTKHTYHIVITQLLHSKTQLLPTYVLNYLVVIQLFGAPTCLFFSQLYYKRPVANRPEAARRLPWPQVKHDIVVFEYVIIHRLKCNNYMYVYIYNYTDKYNLCIYEIICISLYIYIIVYTNYKVYIFCPLSWGDGGSCEL